MQLGYCKGFIFYFVYFLIVLYLIFMHCNFKLRVEKVIYLDFIFHIYHKKTAILKGVLKIFLKSIVHYQY